MAFSTTCRCEDSCVLPQLVFRLLAVFLIPPQSPYLVCVMALTITSFALELLPPALPGPLDCELLEDRVALHV